MFSKQCLPNKVKPDDKADDGTSGEDQQTRIRALAVHHAISIEEKKKLQDKVLDMILVAFDLPSDSTDAAHPSSTDSTTFKECLNLFRPSDLDELMEERNIDDRCGYALCKNPIVKQDPSKNKVWDPKTGKLVDKESETQWCSKECRARNRFVRRQLIEEPAWLRHGQSNEIRLLSDPAIQSERDLSLNDNDSTSATDLVSKGGAGAGIEIHEKESHDMPQPPSLDNTGLVEGFPVRDFSKRNGKTR